MPEPPPDFLRPLASDTRARVQECYQVTSEWRQGRQDLTGIVFTGPGGEALNPGLFLDKFCPDAAALKKRETLFYKAWKTMADGQPADHAEALVKRRDLLLSDLGLPARTLTGKVVWRLVIGLGNPNPLETSLTLHPQYGVPLIPGSAVKGLTRHGRLLTIGGEIGVYPLAFEAWKQRKDAKPRKNTPLELLESLLTTRPVGPDDTARTKCFQELQADKAVLEGIQAAVPNNPITRLTLGALTTQYGDSFRRAFGSTDEQGEIIFLDALPLPGWKYDLDVMTPHYQDYYTDGSNKAPTVAPADWLEPNPITFLTIGQGSRFRFDVFGKDKGLIDEVIDWLKNALSELGAGGKTSAGYGEIHPIP